MTKKKTTKKPAAKPNGKTQPKRKKKAAKKVDPSTLHGFARLAVTDPDRLKQISAKAGKRAQKLYGHKVRWSTRKAKLMAKKGGAAIKRLWRTGKMVVAAAPVPAKPAHPGRRHKAHKPRTLPGSARPPLAIDSQDGVELDARTDPYQGPPSEAPGQAQDQDQGHQPPPYEPLPVDPTNVEYQTPDQSREAATVQSVTDEVRDDLAADVARERER